MPAPRAQRLRSDKYAANINKRGVVVEGKKEKKKSSLGPLVIGFFLFVVVGSAVLQVFQSASFGAAQTARQETTRPRSDKAPREPRARKPRPAAKKAGAAAGAAGDAKDAPKEKDEDKASEAGKAEA